MINAIVKGLFSLLMQLINIVLTPLDTIIDTYLPNFSDILDKINAFFDLLISYTGFGVSYLGLTSQTWTIIILLMTLIITIPLLVHAIKLALKWYRMLMP